ncbi:hypothetical protein UFOVP299_50 [uncultured Caudovirales phage]|uniref:Uncharacterized protein n=1 Tax=uncultured Caudovirales phage TaxID=2100421 RepID=A0A6J5LTK4_9CAUD|nr:hypothetical protein UFOVP299_50 [uncultured Caudovirales phage]
MTIYQIKQNVINAPYFFDTKTLKCFGQTLKSFKVVKLENGNFYIYAPRNSGGFTEREFNPLTNKFI